MFSASRGPNTHSNFDEIDAVFLVNICDIAMMIEAFSSSNAQPCQRKFCISLIDKVKCRVSWSGDKGKVPGLAGSSFGIYQGATRLNPSTSFCKKKTC